MVFLSSFVCIGRRDLSIFAMALVVVEYGFMCSDYDNVRLVRIDYHFIFMKQFKMIVLLGGVSPSVTI